VSPERALLARMLTRLDIASTGTAAAPSPVEALVHVSRAAEAAKHWAWLTAEMATLETET
jgi:hypothetical protein